MKLTRFVADATFSQALTGNWFIKFYAPWCKSREKKERKNQTVVNDVI
jgi:hypothetical protein